MTRSRFPHAASRALTAVPVVAQRVDVTAVLRAAVAHRLTGPCERFRFFVAAAVAVHAWRLPIARQSLPAP